MHMCNWITLLDTWNTVNQLHFNLKKKKDGLVEKKICQRRKNKIHDVLLTGVPEENRETRKGNDQKELPRIF